MKSVAAHVPYPSRYSNRFIVCLVGTFLLVCADPVRAFQNHPAPEGLYAHQMAHIFFLTSMILLAYWLQIKGFTKERGWRFIQVACVLFAAWNLLTTIGHWVEEQLPELTTCGPPDWRQYLRLEPEPLWMAYYVLKLDHLVCVPAMLCLLLGLKHLTEKVSGKDRRDV